MNDEEKRMNTKQKTWVGRPGEINEHYMGNGVRVSVLEWKDGTGEVNVRLIQGDGRTNDFVVHYEKNVVGTQAKYAAIQEAMEVTTEKRI